MFGKILGVISLLLVFRISGDDSDCALNRRIIITKDVILLRLEATQVDMIHFWGTTIHRGSSIAPLYDGTFLKRVILTARNKNNVNILFFNRGIWQMNLSSQKKF